MKTAASKTTHKIPAGTVMRYKKADVWGMRRPGDDEEIMVWSDLLYSAQRDKKIDVLTSRYVGGGRGGCGVMATSVVFKDDFEYTGKLYYP